MASNASSAQPIAAASTVRRCAGVACLINAMGPIAMQGAIVRAAENLSISPALYKPFTTSRHLWIACRLKLCRESLHDPIWILIVSHVHRSGRVRVASADSHPDQHFLFSLQFFFGLSGWLLSD